MSNNIDTTEADKVWAWTGFKTRHPAKVIRVGFPPDSGRYTWVRDSYKEVGLEGVEMRPDPNPFRIRFPVVLQELDI